MRRGPLLAIIFLSLAAPAAQAEYRVYQYLVKPKDQGSQVTAARARAVASTLNPVAYRAYHGGSSVDLTLMRTWMCPGYTGRGRELCPAPGDREARP